MNTERIFCYAPQRRAIECDLPFFNPRHIIPIEDDCTRIMGTHSGVFVNNATHPRQPPALMKSYLQRAGYVTWTIDDSWARQLAAACR